jgi:hypothetical protein
MVVGEGVDVKGESEVGFGGVEDGFAAGDPGVVDEDCWLSMLISDLFGRSSDCGWLGDVAGVVGDI